MNEINITHKVYKHMKSDYEKAFQRQFGYTPKFMEDIPLFMKVLYAYYSINAIPIRDVFIAANFVYRITMERKEMRTSWNEHQLKEFNQYYEWIMQKFKSDMKIR